MGRFSPEDIDPTLCTHVVYAFATLKDHLLTEGSDKDAEMYKRLIALRDKNPDIKVFIMKLSKILSKNSTNFDRVIKITDSSVSLQCF